MWFKAAGGDEDKCVSAPRRSLFGKSFVGPYGGVDQ